jgi:hypothetical protein
MQSLARYQPTYEPGSQPSGRPDSRCWRADRLRARRGARAGDPRSGICARPCTDDPSGCACRGVAGRCQRRARCPPAQGLLDRVIGRTIGASRRAPAQSNTWGRHNRRVHLCRREPAGRCHRHFRPRRPAKATRARLHDPYRLDTSESPCDGHFRRVKLAHRAPWGIASSAAAYSGSVANSTRDSG